MYSTLKAIGCALRSITQTARARSSGSLESHTKKRKKFLTISIMALVGGCLCATVRATPQQDLDNAVTGLATETTTTTGEEAAATTLLTQTNITQSSVLIAGIVTGTKGTSVDVPLTLIPGPDSPTALQFNISVPVGVTISSVSVGAAATAAGKSVQFSSATLSTVLFGLNQTSIGDGVVAIVHTKLASTATSGSLLTVGLTTPAASNAAGSIVPLCLTSGILRVK